MTSITLGPVATQRTADGCRVTADVDGTPLWYETADTELAASVEALAGATVLAALAHGASLRTTGPVSPEWLANVERAMVLWHDWWGYPILPLSAEVLTDPRPQATATALSFTGGVDSFHTLLTASDTPEVLAFVHGYRDEHNRAYAAVHDPMMREVASSVGAEPVVLRSNLWAHPLFASVKLKHTMAGAVAAIGHLLADRVGTLLVSSGLANHQAVRPQERFGSHWELDPLWSSERLEVVHYGATHTRIEKLTAIADHELVQHHLRVCIGGGVGNCSRCDKCVFTMATIVATHHDPRRFVTFDWSRPIVERLDRRPRTMYVRTYPRLLEHDVDPELAVAIRSLLERTHHPRRRVMHRVAKRVLRRGERSGRGGGHERDLGE